jgi:hypothetical protein
MHTDLMVGCTASSHRVTSDSAVTAEEALHRCYIIKRMLMTITAEGNLNLFYKNDSIQCSAFTHICQSYCVINSRCSLLSMLLLKESLLINIASDVQCFAFGWSNIYCVLSRICGGFRGNPPPLSCCHNLQNNVSETPDFALKMTEYFG